jgi:hypothetical protein
MFEFFKAKITVYNDIVCNESMATRVWQDDLSMDEAISWLITSGTEKIVEKGLKDGVISMDEDIVDQIALCGSMTELMNKKTPHFDVNGCAVWRVRAGRVQFEICSM